MRIGKRGSHFLAIAMLTLGMGFFTNPSPVLASHHLGDEINNNDDGNDNNDGGKPGSSVPEPSTLLLLGSGMAGLAIYMRKWKRKEP